MPDVLPHELMVRPMPLSEFQKQVLRLLAPQRTLESYVAGGSPIAAATSRYSGDFDIFHDRAELVSKAALADAHLLHKNGFTVHWHRQRSEEHTSELHSLMRTSYADYCLKK